jgi:membrane protease YdiL (CAAX protease family)
MESKTFTWLKEHPLVLFFPLAYLFSTILWFPQIASAKELTTRPVSTYWHLIGGLGPMLAAILVTGITSGRDGLRELATRVFKWRVDGKWHLFAWFAPVVIFLIGTVIVRLVWNVWPNFRLFGSTNEYPQLPLLVWWAANIIFYGFGEEVGWRGFALPRMQKKYGALTATVILSVFWTIWHLPLFWFIPGYMKMGLGDFMGLSLSFFLGAVIFTWLYNSAKGSILIVAVFHGASDIAFTTPSPGNLDVVIGILMTVLGIVIILTHKPATLSKLEKQVIEI